MTYLTTPMALRWLTLKNENERNYYKVVLKEAKKKIKIYSIGLKCYSIDHQYFILNSTYFRKIYFAGTMLDKKIKENNF